MIRKDTHEKNYHQDIDDDIDANFDLQMHIQYNQDFYAPTQSLTQITVQFRYCIVKFEGRGEHEKKPTLTHTLYSFPRFLMASIADEKSKHAHIHLSIHPSIHPSRSHQNDFLLLDNSQQKQKTKTKKASSFFSHSCHYSFFVLGIELYRYNWSKQPRTKNYRNITKQDKSLPISSSPFLSLIRVTHYSITVR